MPDGNHLDPAALGRASGEHGPLGDNEQELYSEEPVWVSATELPVQPVLVRRGRPFVNLVLVALTFLTTTAAGAFHYASYAADFGGSALPSPGTAAVGGLWYSLTIMAILGAHELGHYFACRYYAVDASLPYFLPAPIPLTGTLGAFIKIRQQIRSKRVLFDIGVAGPFAGFAVALPALLLGVGLSHISPVPDDMEGLWLGEPLLFKAVAWLLWGNVPDGYGINLHPMGFAAWFGLLATALNLFPVGQLDGGHVSYAVLGRRSSYVTLGMVAVAIGLTFFSMSWLFWTMLLVVMIFVMGPHHPRTLDEHVPLDKTRMALAAIALVMFVLCFTPAPIEPMDLLAQE